VKVLAILALAGLLAACDIGATTPSEPSLPSIGESSTTASASTSASMEESPTAMSCGEAFAGIDAAAIIAMGNLDAVTDQLDSTLAACSTADEWESAAENALAGLDISDPQGFIAARCANATSLVGAAICSEIGS
jgi:hypothetical protein